MDIEMRIHVHKEKFVNKSLKATPIIAFTAHAQIEYEHKSLEVGCTIEAIKKYSIVTTRG